MRRLETASARTVVIALAVIIVVGGFALALLGSFVFGSFGTFSPASTLQYGPNPTNAVGALQSSLNGAGAVYYIPQGSTQQVQTVTASTTTASYPGTFTASNQTGTVTGSSSAPPVSSLGTGALIEFSSDVSIESVAPQETASGVVALAYSVGGYVAYQSTYKSAAYVVIRVPASEYQSVLSKVEAMGNVSSLVSNSNDVKVQYTDLNATLASLRTEQGALLRLLNQSTTINSTLAIESQLQGVNQQINYIQSQILQTRTLIDFATIDVTISKSAQKTPLSMTLSATPLNGTAPFSVTFNAIVKGGAQPYVVNYNFGDGEAYQGQILIHTYYSSGDFKVTVTATDQNGTVAIKSTTIHVEAAPSQYGFGTFPATLANLFISVVEGIVEVAVVVLPLAAVAAVVVIPLRRRSRAQKGIKQGQ